MTVLTQNTTLKIQSTCLHLDKVSAGRVLTQADIDHLPGDHRVDGVLHRDAGPGVGPGHAPARVQTEVGVKTEDALRQLDTVTAADLSLTLIIIIIITVTITGHSGHRDQEAEYH